MRRLLAAADVLMADPVMAVDYVKCEAMQKAFERADNAHFSVLDEISYEYGKINCHINSRNFCMKDANRTYKKEILADPR